MDNPTETYCERRFRELALQQGALPTATACERRFLDLCRHQAASPGSTHAGIRSGAAA